MRGRWGAARLRCPGCWKLHPFPLLRLCILILYLCTTAFCKRKTFPGAFLSHCAVFGVLALGGEGSQGQNIFSRAAVSLVRAVCQNQRSAGCAGLLM